MLLRLDLNARDGVDMVMLSIAQNVRAFMERLPPREGSSISDDRGCGSLAGGASPSSRLSTKTTGTSSRRVDAQRAWIYAGDSGALSERSKVPAAGANRRIIMTAGLTVRDIDEHFVVEGMGDGVASVGLTRHLP